METEIDENVLETDEWVESDENDLYEYIFISIQVQIRQINKYQISL